LEETSSFGLRLYEAERRVTARHHVEVSTSYGPVRVKVGGCGSAAPEFDDCCRVAQAAGVPLKEIYAAALTAYRSSK